MLTLSAIFVRAYHGQAELRKYQNSKFMKLLLQKSVRALHSRLLRKPLPRRLGIYFHALEKADWHSFREFVSYFRDNGYTFLDLESYLATSERAIHVSFDDNYRSWYESLWVLDLVGVTATYFTNTQPLRDRASKSDIESYFKRINHSGDPVTLSSSELKAIYDAGHTIGCHSHTHRNLTTMPFADAIADITNNKEVLESIIGDHVRHFSYPFGMRRDFNARLANWVLSNGFETISCAIPCMQYSTFRHDAISRSGWRFHASLEDNLVNLSIDGRLFERLTGRSAVG